MSTHINNMQFNLFGKKYKCETCGEKFKNQVDLDTHRQNQHKA